MSVKITIDGHPKHEVNEKHGLTLVICKTIQTCWWFDLYKVRAVFISAVLKIFLHLPNSYKSKY